METLTIAKLLDKVLVIKKKPAESKFFITTSDSIIIEEQAFVTLLNYLVKNGHINPKVIEGILEELHTL